MGIPRGFALAAVLVLAGCAADPASTALPDGPPAPTRLRIASWNIEWLHRADGHGERPRVDADYERLRRYAGKLDADVIALQEVDGEQAARRVFDPATYAFHFTSDAGQRQPTGFAYRRTLRAVRHPDVVALGVEGKRRGADLEIEVGGRSIRLLCVHLKSRCPDLPLDAPNDDCAFLARQVPALEAWIDARAREETPYVVVGDFNRHLGREDDLWRELDDGDPPGVRLLDAGAGQRPPCWDRRHREYIDHIVLGGESASWLVPGSFAQVVYSPEDAAWRAKLSDHCPILADLSVGAAGPAAAGTTGGVTPAVAPRDALAHVGERARVCGTVASARYAATARDRPTFLNLERPHPDQPFTVVVWGSDRARFGEPEATFAGKRICVTGTIETYKGRPQIVARDPSQVALAD